MKLAVRLVLDLQHSAVCSLKSIFTDDLFCWMDSQVTFCEFVFTLRARIAFHNFKTRLHFYMAVKKEDLNTISLSCF